MPRLHPYTSGQLLIKQLLIYTQFYTARCKLLIGNNSIPSIYHTKYFRVASKMSHFSRTVTLVLNHLTSQFLKTIHINKNMYMEKKTRLFLFSAYILHINANLQSLLAFLQFFKNPPKTQSFQTVTPF